MGSGCFKPPTSNTQLDLSLLDNIYDDIKQYNQSSTSNIQRNTKVFQQIKDRISKKGQLKKLCDYLSSHKSRICETVLHSYRIMNQSKIFAFKYVTIIFVEGIFNSIPKNSNNSIQNSSKVLSAVESNLSNKNTSNPLTPLNKSISQRQVEDFGMLETRRKNNGVKMNNQQLSYLALLKSHKFQNIYFSIICTLIQENDFIYKLTLENLLKYCHILNSIDRLTGKFNNQTQIGEIMKNIYYHIKVNNCLDISLRCYNVMLSKLRDAHLLANLDYIQVFFDLWTLGSNPHYKHSVQSQNQIQLSLQSTTAQNQEIINIISQFIEVSVQNYHYTEIVQEIFKLFDRLKFERLEIIKIENILFNTVNNSELKSQFNRNIMLYLITYASYPGNMNRDSDKFLSPSTSEVQISAFKVRKAQIQEDGISENKKQKIWTQCYKYAYNSLQKKYKHILNPECKQNAFETLSRWLFGYKMVDLLQILTYSKIQLFNCYIFNLYIQDGEQINDEKKVQKIFERVIQGIKQKKKQKQQKKTNSPIEIVLRANQVAAIFKQVIISKLLQLLTIVVRNISIYRIGDTLMELQIQHDELRFVLLHLWYSLLQLHTSNLIGHPISSPSSILTSNSIMMGQTMDIIDENLDYIMVKLNINGSFSQNLKKIQIMGLIISKLNTISIGCYLRQICSFFKSIETQLLSGYSSSDQKIVLLRQFSDSFKHVKSKEKEQKLQGIFLAFLKRVLIYEVNKNQQDYIETHLLFIDNLVLILSEFLSISVTNTNLQSYILKLLKASSSEVMKVLDQYSSDRIALNLDLELDSLEKKDFAFYQESSEYFRQKKEKDKLDDQYGVTGSVFWKKQPSFSGDSVNTRFDRDLEDVLDIIQND